MNRLDIVKLIHFHLGSQITDIRYIKSGLQEVARFYSELRALGVDVTHVDVGGGLGVDYDGTNSTSNASVNYSLQEYANDVIYTIGESCRDLELPKPHIISESGRALTAHHALLLLKVIDVESVVQVPMPTLTDDDHALLHEMAEDFAAIKKAKVSRRKVREVFHDVTFDKERAQQLFTTGVLSLRERALAEQMYHATMNGITRVVTLDRDDYEDILEDLDAVLVDRYFCNFSVFQSAPDLGHRPALPDHADSSAGRGAHGRATLADLTCDSDGMIDHFIDVRRDEEYPRRPRLQARGARTTSACS